MTATDRIDFFIMGSERSGTTVTGVTLDQMPDICAVQATMVITRLNNLWMMIRKVVEQGGVIEGVSGEHCDDFAEFLRDTRPTPFLHRCLFNFCFYENLVNSARSDVTKDVMSQKAYVEAFDFDRYMARFEEGDGTWASTVAAMYSEFASATGSDGIVFGEQTPDNSLYIPGIMELFPKARFIFMVRHPITGVASLMDRYGDLDYCVRQYRTAFAHFPFSDKAAMDRTLFVKFEDLLRGRDTIINHIRNFVGLEPLEPGAGTTTHDAKMFARYVGNSLTLDRYYRSLEKIPDDVRVSIYEKNNDIAETFYSEDETRVILGHKARAA